MGVAQGNQAMEKASKESLKKAMTLKDRASELEKFYITAHYAGEVGDLEKSIDIYEQWHSAYPRDTIPLDNLGGAYVAMGDFDKALQMALEEMKVDPNGTYSYQDLVYAYIVHNRFDEAKALAEQAIDKKLDSLGIHRGLFLIAFVRRDFPEMDRQAAWSRGKLNEPFLLFTKVEAESMLGKNKQAQQNAPKERRGEDRNAGVFGIYGCHARSELRSCWRLRIWPRCGKRVVAAASQFQP